ncbi:histone-lysine N-methyltransferase SETMAR-like [Stegodyphus dumicola]|uniref:histone-lysine N-methyltransferase SETMAR-like n=1 Tax=Stegodyphus dumicola TaxID=202533 RepID=UPI0015B339B4|nr:histone-lysine N-methyltransferase SETMAR-like [Stegodyphus dumicola]
MIPHVQVRGYISHSNAPRNGRPQALDDKALKAAIKSDSSQTYGKLATHFQVSDGTIRLHLRRIGKAYKLSKWVPYSLSNANKQQRVAACLPLLTRHRNTSIFDRVLTSDEKWVQYDTPGVPDIGFHHGTLCHTADFLHPHKDHACIWWIVATVAP